MARAVAEIDGDSSGLVGALDQGKKGMEKLEAEGKKLSDQLREVTDSADKAAGALVQKIGGPKAITAIAGAGAAFGAAKMGVDFFLNSVEKLFKSMGDEGMKVWNDVEKALDSVTGAFAKAVLGGGSAEDMGKKLITVFQGLATVVEFLVTYGLPVLRVAFEALYWVMDKLGQVTKDDADKFDALKRAQDTYASASSVTNVENLTKAYADLSTTINGLVGDEAELALSKNDEATASLIALQANIMKAGNAIRDVRIREEVQKAHDTIVKSVEAEVANMDFSYAGMGWKIERDRAIAERVATAEAERYSSISKQWSGMKGKTAYDFLPEALKLTFDAAQADLSKLEERGKQLYEKYLGHDVKPPIVTTGVSKSGSGEDTPEAKEAKFNATIARLNAKFTALTEKMEKERDDIEGLATGIHPTEGFVDSWIDTLRKGIDDAKGLYAELVTAVTSGNEEIKESTTTGLTAEQEARKANYDQFVNQNAKQVAVALQGGATIADAARAALGNIVTALGDKAMTQAAIEFATGNIAGAAALTAAGAAAYATGAYLGATDKKSGSATKATAKEAAVTNNQTNYNLRVDAAFADEESIARAFSKAQRLANTRYLGSAAY